MDWTSGRRSLLPIWVQVVAQLTSLDGRVAAKASRAVMLRSDWWSLR